MRWMSLGVVLVALQARADIPPDPARPDLSCVGQPEGASCGNGGRCVQRTTRRPDFSKGGVPTWVTTEVMVCEGSRTLDARVGLSVLMFALLSVFLLLRPLSKGRGVTPA